MSILQAPRGMKDLLGEECRAHWYIMETARKITACYGCTPIETPLLEDAKLFLRGLGNTTDVVSKEMYLLEDRNGDQLALRPEATAGVMRAFLNSGLTQTLPQRFFSAGPMFRYERPQKGRLRQFHQLNVEIIGASEPLADVETIAMGAHLLKALGINDGVTLKINTLGDAASRHGYRQALVAFFQKHANHLSEESRERLEKNPLRILDSKDAGDRLLIQEAPRGEAFLTPAAQAHFQTVLTGLDRLEIAYEIDPYLVRGLDYYCHTVFEFMSRHLGAQATILGGGRYDGLTAQLGGADLSGVGWGAGIERLALLLPSTPPLSRPVAVVPISEEQTLPAFQLADLLRKQGVSVAFELNGQLGKRMKKAAKLNASIVLILGEEEVAHHTVVWKDMDTGHQETLSREEVMRRLSNQ